VVSFTIGYHLIRLLVEDLAGIYRLIGLQLIELSRVQLFDNDLFWEGLLLLHLFDMDIGRFAIVSVGVLLFGKAGRF